MDGRSRVPTACRAAGAALIAVGSAAMRLDGAAVLVMLAGVALVGFGMGFGKPR